MSEEMSDLYPPIVFFLKPKKKKKKTGETDFLHCEYSL